MLDFNEKNDITINKLPLYPLKDMRIIKDTLNNLLNSEEYTKYSDDYIYAIVTDEEELFDPIGQLRNIYKNILLLEIENTRSQYIENDLIFSTQIKEKDPFLLFQEFYFSQNNVDISPSQEKILLEILNNLGGGE